LLAEAHFALAKSKARVKMSRTKGATNKNKQPIELNMSEGERLNVLANLILEVVTDELSTESAESGHVAATF